MNSGQKVQKPVYDCKGIVAVKFSAVKQNLQVQYKHLPVHTSYEERAPPPRHGTKRWKLAAMYNPGRYVANFERLSCVESRLDQIYPYRACVILRSVAAGICLSVSDDSKKDRAHTRTVDSPCPAYTL